MRANVLVAAITVIILAVSGAFAAVPSQINFQGTLTDSVGNPVNDDRQLFFAIYADSIGGLPLWSETHSSVEVTDGLFHVVLGSVTGLPASIFDDAILWLETTVEEETLIPRTKLVTVPYGFKSNNADQATWAESADYATYADTAYYAAVSMPDADWTVNADTIYHLNGNVGIGTAYPTEKLDVNGTVKMTGFQLTGVRSSGDVLTSDENGVGTWQPATGGGGLTLPFEDSVHVNQIAFKVNNGYDGYGGIAIWGGNGASGNYAYIGHLTRAVYASSDSGHAIEGFSYGSGFAGYFEGKMYASGNVGIGTEYPSEMLDVNGTARLTGFKMPTGASNGYVLTSDGSGTGTWQEAAGGGFSLPFADSVDVAGYGFSIRNVSTSYGAIGVSGENATSGNYGYLGHPSRGVYGNSYNGHAVEGYSSGSGFAGYFTGKMYASGNVGIGTVTPSEMLDVNGTVKMTGFQLTGSRSAGDVLTSDASGVGTWQTPATGFSLPYSGSDNSSSASFEVTNTDPDGMAIKGIGEGGEFGYLGGDSVAVYGYADSTAYAGYFDGRVKVTEHLSVRDGGSYYFDSSFGYALRVYNDNSAGTSIYAHNASGTYVKMNYGSDALWAENNSGPIGILGAYNAGVHGYANAPGHAGYFSGDVYVSSDLGIGTQTPEQQLDVYGDAYIGGGSNAHDGLDEMLRIRGMSDDWIVGVTNESTVGATDFYVGTTGEDGKFHIENGGDVGIGTNSPDAKLEVVGDVKTGELDVNGAVTLGTNGSRFLEIIEIIDTTASTGTSMQINYPAGYASHNTRVLSLEIYNFRDGEYIGLGHDPFLGSDPVTYALSYNYIFIYFPGTGFCHYAPFRMILMKMP